MADVTGRLQALTPEQRALFELLRQKQQSAQRAQQPPPAPKVRRVSGAAAAGDWPLSFDQERLWRMHQEDPGLVSWNVDAGSRALGGLDVAALYAALCAVVRRHAAWRTTFPLVAAKPVQRVFADLPPELSVIDLTALPPAVRESVGLRTIFERTRGSFDLQRGPLVRMTLVRTDERDHLFLLTVHHLVTDWITFQVAFQELAVFYAAFRAGQSAELPALPVQFPDFVLWEREWLQGEVLEAYAAFWRRELEGFPPAIELPADRPRPPVQSQRGGMFRIRAGGERTDRLRSLSHREGATLFMGVLAVLYALFHRLSGGERIVIGSNSANRARPELDQVFGLFLTQVPFATDASGDPPFRELLARSRRTALSAFAWQNFPFSKLIEALGLAPDRGRNPVVQALLLLLEGSSGGRLGDLETRALALFDGNSRWDLMFGLYDFHDAGLSGPLEYNAEIFDAATIGRLVELLYRTVDSVTADPQVRLSQLPAFAETARVQVLTGAPKADEETERRAGRLLAPLRRLGVGPGVKVALFLDPSPELAAAALAVRRAGGVCLPVSPGEPEVRLSALLADAELKVLIHRGGLPAGLALLGVSRADLDEMEAAA